VKDTGLQCAKTGKNLSVK